MNDAPFGPNGPFHTDLRVREGQFVNERTAKSLVVVHHTADGSPEASVRWWNQDPARVATAYVVDRDGRVHETFDPDYWAYHTGCGARLDRRSVGVELTNWGFLERKGDRYFSWTGVEVPADDVHTELWRGELYWQRYPEAQVEAACELVRQLVRRYGIDPDCAPPDREGTDTARWRRFLGVVAHYHVRADKTDVSPAFPWDRLTAAVEGAQAPARPAAVDMAPIEPKGPVELPTDADGDVDAETADALEVQPIPLPRAEREFRENQIDAWEQIAQAVGRQARPPQIVLPEGPVRLPGAPITTSNDERRIEGVVEAARAGRWAVAAWRAFRLALSLRKAL